MYEGMDWSPRLHQKIGAPAGLQQQQRQAVFAELWVSFELDAYTGSLSRRLDCQWRRPLPVQQHIHVRLMHAAVDERLPDCAAKLWSISMRLQPYNAMER